MKKKKYGFSSARKFLGLFGIVTLIIYQIYLNCIEKFELLLLLQLVEEVEGSFEVLEKFTRLNFDVRRTFIWEVISASTTCCVFLFLRLTGKISLELQGSQFEKDLAKPVFYWCTDHHCPYFASFCLIIIVIACLLLCIPFLFQYKFIYSI